MQPRSLDQILAELNPIYQPQVDLYQRRQAEIPNQIQAEERGLDAKKDVAYDDILSGARRRGLGFAGIPLAEQAKYNATDYLPAIARLRQQGREQAMSLEEALVGVNQRKSEAAFNMRQYEQKRYDDYMEQLRREEEARRQQAASRAAAASFAPSFGGGGGPSGGAGPAAQGNKPTLQSFLGEKYAQQPNAPRALQDQWVRQWAKLTGKNEGDNAIWQAYNQMYPWEQWNDNAQRSNPTINWGGAAKASNPMNLIGAAGRRIADNYNFFTGKR